MIPHEKPRLLRVLEDLALPEGQWALSGSGVLVMHGIERNRPMGDVDIWLATRPWFGLLSIDDPTPWGGFLPRWNVFTTDPENPATRCDPAFLFKEMHGIEVNIFCQWRTIGVGDINVTQWINDAELVEGIPCVPLQHILNWKDEMGRAKDSQDIEVLKKHLARKRNPDA